MPSFHLAILMAINAEEEEDKREAQAVLARTTAILLSMPWASVTIRSYDDDTVENDVNPQDSIPEEPEEPAATPKISELEAELKGILPDNTILLKGDVSSGYFYLGSPRFLHQSKEPFIIEGTLVPPFAVHNCSVDIELDVDDKMDNTELRKNMIDNFRQVHEYASVLFFSYF